MAEENKKKVVIRTQVYLNDPEYFCSKSWTMSYNLNTQKWISFHSYIPNFYIGENNFFYSGVNGCCDDGSFGGFQAIAGVMDRTPPTTTSTTTFYPSPTTTITTTTLDCNIDGTIIVTDCNMDGTAIITVFPTTTTTICQRPSNLLTQFVFIEGYTLGTDPEVIFSGSLEEACSAISSIDYINANPTGNALSTFNVYANTTTTELQVGNIVYYGDSTDCTLVPDGWYYSAFPLPLVDVYHIVGGVITQITTCNCETTTTTTTLVPTVTECCGILFSSNDDIYYSNRTTDELNQLNVPGYVSSLGIAMTANYLWSIDTTIEQWDIFLTPFSATYNTSIALPGGYIAGKGIVAKNDNILISTDTSVSPHDVVELDVTGLTATATIMFSLQANRESTGNMLYTTDGKLIVINQDVTTSDYYVTQYDYLTGIIETDINVGSVAPVSIYACSCDIYLTDTNGNLYIIIKIIPYALFDLGVNVNVSSIDSATQVATCVVSSITEDVTTTTTTTVAPTTTTTTTP
jgi:hypothetical protein